MALFGFLGGNRGTIAPVQPPPQEKFNTGYRHPLMSGYTGAKYVDPYRVRTSSVTQRSKNSLTNNTGRHLFVYDSNIQRVPDSATQVKFNQKGLLPPVDVGVPINGVHVPLTPKHPTDDAKYGGFVTPDSRGDVHPAHTPVVLLSTPINVTTNQLAYGNPELQASNNAHPPLNIVPYADRKVPRRVGYGK